MLRSDLSQPHRLIVILPDNLAGSMDLADKVYHLALREKREVLYLTLFDDYEKMLPKARQMATMVAMTAGNTLTVNSRLVSASQWFKTLQEICRPEDAIVCQAEQTVKTGITKVLPLAEYLHSILPNRIIVMSGYYKPVQEQIKRFAIQLLFWAGFLVIFALFLLLEIYLDHNLAGTMRMVMLCLVVCVEFGAVYAWNSVIRS